MSDSLETTPYEACNLESIHILQPHQPLGGPLDVFQFGQTGLIFFVTGPEGWTAEGQKVNGGGLSGDSRELWGSLVINTRCVSEEGSDPTLCVLQGFVAVDDIQPLGL